MTDVRPTILISDPVLSPSISRFEAEGWRVGKLWDLAADERASACAIIHAGGRDLAPALLASLPQLGLIANVAVGCDGVDLAWCGAHGVAVTRAHGVNADDTADHAMGLILSGWRRILEGDQAVRRGEWDRERHSFSVPTLQRRRLGVVGLGAIGEAVARRGEAFGWSVAWWGPRVKPAPWPRCDSLLALAGDSDILVVACRADASTRGLISAQVIDAVGPAGMLINVSRGYVIDEDALIAALVSRRLGAAGLDVFLDEPTPQARWRDVPNTVLTPHIGGQTRQSVRAMIGQAVDCVRDFLAGQPVRDIAAGDHHANPM